MRTRRKLNYEALALVGGVWFTVGLVVFVAVVLTTPRHSEATRIAALVWVLPLGAGAIGVLWALLPEAFGVRPRFGPLWHREREPVTEDLRRQEKG